MYREILLTSMEMFDDKKGTFSDKIQVAAHL